MGHVMDENFKIFLGTIPLISIVVLDFENEILN